MKPTLRRSKRLEMKRDKMKSDKLSELPNAILLYIMSFMMIKDVVKTSVLSKRWKNLWKHLPDLKLHSSEFNKPSSFAKCIAGIVSSRMNGNYPLHTLDFDHRVTFQPKLFYDLITLAITQGLKKLKVVVPPNLGLPHCVYISHSLTSLHITSSIIDPRRRNAFPNPKCLNLPSLTSLHLDYVGIETDHNGYVEPFSTIKNLKSLFIEDFYFLYPSEEAFEEQGGVLHITNAALTNLTIEDISYPTYKYVISTPRLISFTMNGSPFQASDFPEVKVELSSLM